MQPPLEELFESSLRLDSPEKTLRQLPSSRSVLLFADNNKRPIQLLSVTSLRRTALSKLAEPKSEEPIRKADLRPIASILYYTLINCEFHGMWLYNRLANLLFPENPDLISLPVPHCVCIIPNEAWASFVPTSHPGQDLAAIYYGPFPTRKASDFFAQTFNTLFALCRNRPLATSGQGLKCSYYQMGLCPGPCLHPGDEVQYRQTVLQAIQAASDSIENLQERLTAQMNMFAAKMQFEQAQIIKNQLVQLSKLKTSTYRWTRRLDTLKILHIDLGSKIFTAENLRQKSPRFCAYLITSSYAEKAQNFSLSSIANALNILTNFVQSHPLSSKTPEEHLALTSLFLYKSHRPGLWIDLHEQDVLPANDVLNALIERFSGMPNTEDE